jgi:hypothetical protein
MIKVLAGVLVVDQQLPQILRCLPRVWQSEALAGAGADHQDDAVVLVRGTIYLPNFCGRLNLSMDHVGSGKPIPVTDPEDQRRVDRIKRLAALTGPADKSRCADCGSPDTTDDVYSVGAKVNATGAEQKGGDFYLCAPCVTSFYADMEALQRLGRRGVQ